MLKFHKESDFYLPQSAQNCLLGLRGGGGSSPIFVCRCAISEFDTPPFDKAPQRRKFDVRQNLLKLTLHPPGDHSIFCFWCMQTKFARAIMINRDFQIPVERGTHSLGSVLLYGVVHDFKSVWLALFCNRLATAVRLRHIHSYANEQGVAIRHG